MKANRYREILRSTKFLLFSLSAGIIEMGTFSLVKGFAKLSYWPCYLIALVLSVLWNFTLNRRYTFQSANNVPVAMIKIAGFYCVFTPLSTIGGNYLADTLLWNAYFVTAMNMVVNFILEFLYDRFFVFGRTLDTNELAHKNKQGTKK